MERCKMKRQDLSYVQMYRKNDLERAMKMLTSKKNIHLYDEIRDDRFSFYVLVFSKFPIVGISCFYKQEFKTFLTQLLLRRYWSGYYRDEIIYIVT